MAVLMYDDLGELDSPRQALLDYLESAYRAGTKRANWNLDEFELNTNISK